MKLSRIISHSFSKVNKGKVYYSYIDFLNKKYSSASHYERPFYYTLSNEYNSFNLNPYIIDINEIDYINIDDKLVYKKKVPDTIKRVSAANIEIENI